jgi:hypothetical protein
MTPRQEFILKTVAEILVSYAASGSCPGEQQAVLAVQATEKLWEMAHEEKCR